MAFTWTTLSAQLVNYLQQDPASTNFTAALPTIVSNAELRIYRELDFLATRGQNSSVSFTGGSRTLSLAGMTGQLVGGLAVAPSYPIVVQGLAVIIPFPDLPAAGTRVRFTLTSVDFIDAIWPQEAVTGTPGAAPTPFAYYAMLDHQTAIVAPTPATDWVAEVTGTFRPAPMSATNEETWLGDNLPDLLFCACMIEGFKYQREVSDPKMALPWEQRYEECKTAAFSEEQRRKGLGPSAQPFQPAPELSQTRA